MGTEEFSVGDGVGERPSARPAPAAARPQGGGDALRWSVVAVAAIVVGTLAVPTVASRQVEALAPPLGTVQLGPEIQLEFPDVVDAATLMAEPGWECVQTPVQVRCFSLTDGSTVSYDVETGIVTMAFAED